MCPHPALSVPVESVAAILDVAPIGVALVNTDGRVRWANPEFGRLISRPAGDCVDRAFDELVGLCSGPERVEARCRRPDGEEILLEVVEGPIAAADGGGSYRLVRDITDRRRAETELTQAVSMHRATLESTADGLLVVDRHGRTVSFNHRFLDLWRIPDEVAASGRDAEMLEFVLDQVSDPEAFVARVEQLYAAPEESSYDEIRFRDGRVFERYSQPQQIDGRAVGRVWSFRDVTEALRAREALLFSEDKFAKAFRSSPLRVSISTLAEGRFVEVNDTFLRDHGFTREEVIGRTSPELGLWNDPTMRRKLVEAVRRNGMVRDYEYAGQLRDGRVQTTSISAEVIHVGGEACLLAVATDITERKDAEEKARRSRAELRALAARLLLIREEERTVIAREIHDELGQALTGLKIDLAWLKKRVDDRPELAEEIQSIIERVDGTMDSVRRIATELRPSILDHLGLVAAIEWQAQEFERRTGIKTTLRASQPEIAIDEVRATAVFRMLQETLTNVARHAGASRVDISLTVGSVDLSLDVRDDGRGITPAEIAASRSLGLVGLRERAIACGGMLAIHGTPGRGTHVAVRVPLPGQSLPGWTP
ncbi:MAG TPA: PAS domain S-box protein [Gemmatimonadales bacterium]|jgi:PAS domain S-box-containing protein